MRCGALSSPKIYYRPIGTDFTVVSGKQSQVLSICYALSSLVNVASLVRPCVSALHKNAANIHIREVTFKVIFQAVVFASLDRRRQKLASHF